MTQVELQLDQKLKELDYNRMCSDTERIIEEFENEHEEKEFKEYEVTEELCTIDNLLEIIKTLNERMESLVDDYNDLLTDSVETLENIAYGSFPSYEEI